jgi:hypothetical protein
MKFFSCAERQKAVLMKILCELRGVLTQIFLEISLASEKDSLILGRVFWNSGVFYKKFHFPFLP